MSNILLEENYVGNLFELPEDDVAVAIKSEITKSAREILDDENMPNDMKDRIVKNKQTVIKLTEATLKKDYTVLTSLSNTDVCMTAFAHLRKSGAKGRLVVFGTAADYKKSEIAPFFCGTPNSILILVKDQKGDPEEEKALKEAYKALKDEQKRIKADDPDAEIVKTEWVTPNNKGEMVIWKFISDLCDMACFVGSSYRSITSSSNYLLRYLLAKDGAVDSYAYVDNNPPKNIVEFVNPDIFTAEITAFNDRDVVEYDMQEAVNIIMDTHSKLKPETIHLLSKVDSDIFSECEKTKDLFYVRGNIAKCTQNKVMGIITPTYSDEFIAGYADKTEDFWCAEVPLATYAHKTLTEQVDTLIETGLENNNTLVFAADSEYGAIALERLNEAIKKLGTTSGQAIIYVGNIDFDTIEGEHLDAVIKELSQYDNVATVTFNALKYTKEIPNPKYDPSAETAETPVEESSEASTEENTDPEAKEASKVKSNKKTLKLTFPVHYAVAYAIARVSSKIYCLNDGIGQLSAKTFKYFADTEVCKDCKLTPKGNFTIKPTGDKTPNTRLDAFMEMMTKEEANFKNMLKNGVEDQKVEGF